MAVDKLDHKSINTAIADKGVDATKKLNVIVYTATQGWQRLYFYFFNAFKKTSVLSLNCMP